MIEPPDKRSYDGIPLKHYFRIKQTLKHHEVTDKHFFFILSYQLIQCTSPDYAKAFTCTNKMELLYKHNNHVTYFRLKKKYCLVCVLIGATSLIKKIIINK